MRNNDNGLESNDPYIEMVLKNLAKNKGAGNHRVVCESDGVTTEYWLEGGEVRSRAGLSAGHVAPSVAAFTAAVE